jgi:hypothetical protein
MKKPDQPIGIPPKIYIHDISLADPDGNRIVSAYIDERLVDRIVVARHPITNKLSVNTDCVRIELELDEEDAIKDGFERLLGPVSDE